MIIAFLDDGTYGDRRKTISIKVGLLIPLRGVAGIWGPSSQACAELAARELNGKAGILGREIDIVTIDAGAPRSHVAHALRTLTGGDDPIEALVGAHLSDLRPLVKAVLPPDIPYAYTPLYEGGESTANIFAIGETPDRLLPPGIGWLSDHRRAARWFLVGNDYVWPRMMHLSARGIVARHGGSCVEEAFMPLGTRDVEPVLDRIRVVKPDAVLMSLIGDDAVHFNRAFAQKGLAAHVLRFSTAIDENVLYGIGADNTENMFLSSGYFAHLPSAENDAFREGYHGLFGEAPPMQNDFGESCYEGLHYLAALANHAGSICAPALRREAGSLPPYRSARIRGHGKACRPKVHFVAADGLDLTLVHSQ